MVNIGIRHYNKHLEVYIINNDKSNDPISALNICVKGKLSNTLSKVMRFSIHPQIIKFKENISNLKCEICQSTNNINVDHYNPQFIDLQKSFLEINKLPIPKYFDENTLGIKKFKDEDKDFENEWCKYHFKNAKLRILCKKCNTSQKKSQTKFKHINFE